MENGQRVVASESDERTVNNDGNAMRHAYRVLTDDEKAAMVAIKDKGSELAALVAPIFDRAPREASIARTKIEEAVMWAVKGLTG